MQSYVAGIVDRGGGLRLVVDTSRAHILQYHVGPGERVFWLPVQVREPISLGEVEWCFEQLRARVAEGAP